MKAEYKCRYFIRHHYNCLVFEHLIFDFLLILNLFTIIYLTDKNQQKKYIRLKAKKENLKQTSDNDEIKKNKFYKDTSILNPTNGISQFI